MKISGRRTEDGTVLLSLKGGGEVGVPASQFRGFVPDEMRRRDRRRLHGRPGRSRPRPPTSPSATASTPRLVLAVVSVESSFEPRAVSPKGAQGLMQLMPATAASLGVADAFDPETNLEGGSRYLAELIALYGGDLTKALAAYNAGPGAVTRHGGVPPYRETREYVRKVMKQLQEEVMKGARAATSRRGRLLHDGADGLGDDHADPDGRRDPGLAVRDEERPRGGADLSRRPDRRRDRRFQRKNANALPASLDELVKGSSCARLYKEPDDARTASGGYCGRGRP